MIETGPIGKLVVVESPFSGDRQTNVEYARRCCRDCIDRGEYPFASHLFYPQLLDDNTADQRILGIRAGLAWGLYADLVAVYTDLGFSPGMEDAICHYKHLDIPIEYRNVGRNSPPSGR